jgi:hypothetical protein
MRNAIIKLCGSIKTKTGNACKNRVPCPVHEDGSRKQTHTLNSARRDKFAEGVLDGKPVRKAALDAGYSKNTANGRIYQIMDTPDMRERFRSRVKDAGLDVNEITGTLVQHMRGDLADVFPESPVLQRAKEKGISHLIKKVKARQIVAGIDEDGSPIMGWEHEIEMYSAQEAAKHLTKVFGLEQQPAPNVKAQRDFDAAVQEVMQQAIDAGVELSPDELREEVEKRLKPAYLRIESHVDNN